MNQSAERKPCKFAFTDSLSLSLSLSPSLPSPPLSLSQSLSISPASSLSADYQLDIQVDVQIEVRLVEERSNVLAHESERKICIAILLGRMKKCKCQLNILLIRLCRVLVSVFFCPRSIASKQTFFLRTHVFVPFKNERGERSGFCSSRT